MLNTPFTPWPCYSEDEADAVRNLLLSNKVNYWTGNECRDFETEFAAWNGSRYAVSLMNGTVALDLALKVLGVGRGDEVIVTPRTFLASVSCVVNAGAAPVFADVCRESGNITAESIAKVLTPKSRAIICVHLAGWSCEMDALKDLAAAHNLVLIEDCAQAHGAFYKQQAVGSLSDIGAWSFCQDKIITTGGEGGMVTTNDPVLWEKMWSYKDHGKSWNAIYKESHPPGFRWIHHSFGTNWRMLEYQAVLGRIQLKKLSDWRAERVSNAEAIYSCAKSIAALRVPEIPDHIQHAWYRCYLYVETKALKSGWSRDRIMTEINALGVPCFSGSCSEVYLEKAFDGTEWRPRERLPVAKELGETSLAFLVHPGLQKTEIAKTCDVLKTVFSAAMR